MRRDLLCNRVDNYFMIHFQVVHLVIDKFVPVLRLVNVQLFIELQALAPSVAQVGPRRYNIDWVPGDDNHFLGLEAPLFGTKRLRVVRLCYPHLVGFTSDITAEKTHLGHVECDF